MLAPIAKIKAIPEAQPRVAISVEVVKEYADAIESGAEFPPVVVFFDEVDYWLGDGWHRLEAYRSIGATQVPIDRRTGGRREAILFACGANASHGLPRTNADKQRAVETLLGDAEWVKKSDRWIAEKACVSNAFASKVRASLFTVNSREPREGRDGRTCKPRDKAAARVTPEPQSEREPAPLDFEDAPESRPEPASAAAPVTPARASREQPAAPASQPVKYSNMAVRDGAGDVLKRAVVVWKFMGAADRDLFRREILALMESK